MLPLVWFTDWLPNARLDGDTLRPAVAPVPDRERVCGEVALLAIEMEAVRVPPAVGLNVTLMEQLAPAATELPQLFDWAKSPALEPDIEIPLMLNVMLPGLLRVTDWLELATPRA